MFYIYIALLKMLTWQLFPAWSGPSGESPGPAAQGHVSVPQTATGGLEIGASSVVLERWELQISSICQIFPYYTE